MKARKGTLCLVKGSENFVKEKNQWLCCEVTAEGCLEETFLPFLAVLKGKGVSAWINGLKVVEDKEWIDV